MKKKKKRRVLKLKNIFITLVALLLLTILTIYLIKSPIKNIYIKGNTNIKDDEILETANLYEYPSFFLTNSNELIKKIKKNKYIKSVNITKKLGNILEINIKEYKPIALNKDQEIILETGLTLPNTYNITDIPILINDIYDKNTYLNFTNKFSKIDDNILRQISEIEYSPIEVDKDRFILYMSDGNKVHITLTKIEKLNKYNKIKDALSGKKGIIYLDSGNYVELK